MSGRVRCVWVAVAMLLAAAVVGCTPAAAPGSAASPTPAGPAATAPITAPIPTPTTVATPATAAPGGGGGSYVSFNNGAAYVAIHGGFNLEAHLDIYGGGSFRDPNGALTLEYGGLGVAGSEAHLNIFHDGTWHLDVRPDYGIGVVKTFTCEVDQTAPLVGMPPTPPGGQSAVVDCGPFDLYWVKEGASPPGLGQPPWNVTMQVMYAWGP